MLFCEIYSILPLPLPRYYTSPNTCTHPYSSDFNQDIHTVMCYIYSLYTYIYLGAGFYEDGETVKDDWKPALDVPPQNVVRISCCSLSHAGCSLFYMELGLQ